MTSNILPQESKNLTVRSSAFAAGQKIPKKYTCDDANVSPPLVFEGVPKETKSIALVVDDPDAPVGTWTHWVVWNISSETKEIQENMVPVHAVQGLNDFKTTKYGGPCPPSGVHRYYFKVYALDTLLNLPPGSPKTTLEAAMKNHILAYGELMGKYSREVY